MTHTGQEAPGEAVPKFNPFTGSGRRLDGKPLKYDPPPASSSGLKDKKPEVSNTHDQSSSTSSTQNASRQSQGKLVFGSNTNRNRETPKVCHFILACYVSLFWYFTLHFSMYGSMEPARFSQSGCPQLKTRNSHSNFTSS